MNGGADVAADSDNVTPVNKVDGGVYPTEEAKETETAKETDSVKETQTAKPTESETEKQSEKETESTKADSVDTSVKPSQPAYSTYVVKKGDTMLGICKKYYGNASRLDEVVKLNGMEDANKLYVGQVVKLP